MAKKGKNVLIIISHYIPGYKFGGPVTSVINLVDNLSDEFQFKVLTTDRDFNDTLPYPNICCNIWNKKDNYEIQYLEKSFFTFYHVLRVTLSSKEDIIYLNSLFDPLFSILIVLTKWLGILRPKLLLAPRGELFNEAMAFGRNKKRLFIKISRALGLYKNVHWHASTAIEKDHIVRVLRVKSQMVDVAINLPQRLSLEDLQHIEPTNVSTKGLRIIYLARVSKDKNITFTFDILGQVTHDIVFDIYGPIEDEDIWTECKRKIESLPSNIQVRYMGGVSREKVSNILSTYDLFFLPTFAENYGNVIAESLSVGTPVLISDNTPWRNLYQEGLGWDLPLSQPDKFVGAINEIVFDRKKDNLLMTREFIRSNFANRVSDPLILEATLKMFRRLADE